MTAIERAFVARMSRRAAQLAPELAIRQIAAYDMIRESLTTAELARAIESGQVDQLLNDLLSDKRIDPALVRLRAKLDQGLKESAAAEAFNLPSWAMTPDFDTLSPHVLRAAHELDTRVVTDMKAEIRETVLQVARDGLAAGKNPRVVANRIQQAVGLAPNQAKAVANFRAELESGDRAALGRVLGRGTIRTPDGDQINRMGHAGGQGLTRLQVQRLDRILGTEPLSAVQVDRYTDAYHKRLLAWNAESTARTIALDAQKLGQQLSWEDAIERGVVNASELQETWLAVGGPGGDGRNREEHLAMHGETIPFGGTFSNGQRIPGETDYNCRCIKRTTVKRMAVAA